jgi:hypothetical protein
MSCFLCVFCFLEVCDEAITGPGASYLICAIACDLESFGTRLAVAPLQKKATF